MSELRHSFGSRLLDRADLFRPQLDALHLLEQDLADQGWAFLRAGVRSGKTLIAAAIVARYKRIVVFATTKSSATEMYSDYGITVDFVQTLPPVGDISADQTLVVLNDAMWLKDSYQIYENARERGYHVLIESANGPEFMKPNSQWARLTGRSYDSWQLNPELNEAELRAANAHAVALFNRDFLGY